MLLLVGSEDNFTYLESDSMHGLEHYDLCLLIG